MLTRVGTNALWSVIETLGTIGTTFALISIVSWSYGLEGVGLWSLVTTSAGLAQLGTLGLGAAMTRHLPLALASNEREKAILIIASVCSTLVLIFTFAAMFLYLPLCLYFSAILSGETLDVGHQLLVWTLIGLPFSILADGLLNALLGVHHAAAKSRIVLAAQTLKLSVVASFIPSLGLLALVIGQWAYCGVVIVWGRRCLGRHIGLSWFDAFRFDWRTLRALLPFGLRMQAGSIAVFLFEPTIRLAIGSITGLTMLGAYEMASKLVISVRSILTTALNVTIPAVAEADKKKPVHLMRLMQMMTTCVWLMGTAVMVTLAISAPLISHLWFGEFKPAFVHLVWILDLGWWFTLVMSPAYFLALGKGWADLTLVNHVVMTLLAGPFVIIGCMIGSTILVGFGVSAALFIGTIVFVILTRRRLEPSVTLMAESWWLGLGLGLVSCFALAIGIESVGSNQSWQLAALSVIPLSGIWIDKSIRRLFVAGWRHLVSRPVSC